MRRGTTPATAAASWRVRLILHRLYSACRASSCRDTGLVRPRKGSSLGMVPASCTHRTGFTHRLCISGFMNRLPEQLSLGGPLVSRKTRWGCGAASDKQGIWMRHTCRGWSRAGSKVSRRRHFRHFSRARSRRSSLFMTPNSASSVSLRPMAPFTTLSARARTSRIFPTCMRTALNAMRTRDFCTKLQQHLSPAHGAHCHKLCRHWR